MVILLTVDQVRHFLLPHLTHCWPVIPGFWASTGQVSSFDPVAGQHQCRKTRGTGLQSAVSVIDALSLTHILGCFCMLSKETSLFCGLDHTMGQAIFPGGPHSVEAHLEHVGRAWSAGEECLAPGGVDDMGCCHVYLCHGGCC